MPEAKSKQTRRLIDAKKVQLKHEKIEKHILNTSMVGCIIFLASEIFMAVITHSRTLLSDCLWDSVDLILLLPMLLLSPRLSRKKVTEKRSFGFYPVESLLVVAKTFVLIALSIVLIVENIQAILHGGNAVDGGLIAIYEILVSLFCMVFYLVLKRMEHDFESPMIATEVYTWKLDSYSTLAISAGFALEFILRNTKAAWITPYIDPVLAIIVTASLVKEPLSMLKENLHDLVLFAPDPEIMAEIRTVTERHLKETPYQMTFLDVVKTGRMFWIGVYFKPNTNQIDYSQIKKIVWEISDDLRIEYSDVYVEMIPDTSLSAENPETH
jgi:cation diffusion facilitator family transporter